MSNQNQPLTIDLAKVVFEAVQYSEALDADMSEVLALLRTLDKKAELALEAAINAYTNQVREVAFFAGWQLAKQ
ncbi:MAG: hypothetical protein E6Q97_20995 [Desulfurellales bacterium]|nr:MAG: hypothetical protein E6Q97_20995 [Desulfurellales bacterium]